MATFKTKAQVLKLIPPEFAGRHGSTEIVGFNVFVGPLKQNGTFQRVYQARWRDEFGKDKNFEIGRVSEMDFTEAAAAAKAKVEYEGGRAKAIRRGVGHVPRLGDAYEPFVREKRAVWKPTTLTSYDTAWKNLAPLYDRRMDTITGDDCFELYMKNCAEHGKASALAANRLASSMFTHLIYQEEPVLKNNPCLWLIRTATKHGVIIEKNVKENRAVKTHYLPEFWRLLHMRVGPAQRDYILWGLLTGFRASLLGALSWSRIDFKNHTYKVYALDKGNKSNVEFMFPICDYLWANVVEPRMRLRVPGVDCIIPSPRVPDAPLKSVRGSYTAIKKVLQIELSDHDLRRTFSSVAYRATRDLLIVQRLMTHSSKPKSRETATTELYIETEAAEFAAAVNATAAEFLRCATVDSLAVSEMEEVDINFIEIDKAGNRAEALGPVSKE